MSCERARGGGSEERDTDSKHWNCKCRSDVRACDGGRRGDDQPGRGTAQVAVWRWWEGKRSGQEGGLGTGDGREGRVRPDSGGCRLTVMAVSTVHSHSVQLRDYSSLLSRSSKTPWTQTPWNRLYLQNSYPCPRLHLRLSLGHHVSLPLRPVSLSHYRSWGQTRGKDEWGRAGVAGEARGDSWGQQ